MGTFNFNLLSKTLYDCFGIDKIKQLSEFNDVEIESWRFELPNSHQVQFKGKTFSFSVDITNTSIRFLEFYCTGRSQVAFLTILTSTILSARKSGIQVIKIEGLDDFTNRKFGGTYWLSVMAGFLPIPERQLTVYEIMWKHGFFEQTITEFFSSDEGLNCWKVVGFGMPCEFYVSENSENVKNLNRQLQLLNLWHLLT